MDLFLDAVRVGYDHDGWFGRPENTKKLTCIGGYWFREHALVLPDYHDVRAAALYQVHDAPWAGHVGRARTKAALKYAYWWPTLEQDVAEYVKTWDACQRNKVHHQNPNNWLAPLPVPERPWDCVGIDFIPRLPVCDKSKMDCICVVVDHFSKMVHLVPCLTSMNATEFADLYRRQVFRLHGCTRHIVSDRGTQFTAEFWRQFCKDMGMRLRMSSAYQPSTDGQVERYNQTLEEMLRSFVNEMHDDWDMWLDCAEFAINKAKVASHGCSPFDLVYVHTPLSPPDVMLFKGLPLRMRTVGANPKEGGDDGDTQVIVYKNAREARAYGVQWVIRYRFAKQLLHQVS